MGRDGKGKTRVGIMEGGEVDIREGLKGMEGREWGGGQEGEGRTEMAGRYRKGDGDMGRNFPPRLNSGHLGRCLGCHVLAPAVDIKKYMIPEFNDK